MCFKAVSGLGCVCIDTRLWGSLRIGAMGLGFKSCQSLSSGIKSSRIIGTQKSRLLPQIFHRKIIETMEPHTFLSLPGKSRD